MKALLKISVAVVIMMMVISSCQQPGGNSTGSEYMPDMAHSVAYEANYYNYYYNNTWGSRDDYYKWAQPRLPVKGTIPRTSTNKYGVSIPKAAGSVPYYYGNTEEERTRAMNEIINNPLPITEKGLAEGKELYEINCGICHGNKGDGAGYLVREADPAKGITAGKYTVQPANFMLEEFVNASNGRYYHAIIHGKNVMGGYADKLSHDERWNVIHYIHSLQAKNAGLVYNQKENTFNSIDKPGGEMKIAHAIHHDDGHGHEMHDDGHDDDGHGHDHGPNHKVELDGKPQLDHHPEEGHEHHGEEHKDHNEKDHGDHNHGH